MKQTRYPIIVDSVTKLDARASGAVVVGGSHCGVYAAYLAARLSVRAVILSDAGMGRDRAGIAGLGYLQQRGIAAATIAHTSARIGDGEDCARRGRLSHVNGLASACGLAVDMGTLTAAKLLLSEAAQSTADIPDEKEVRFRPGEADERIYVMDSVSLLVPDDVGAIVVTGSHGGCLGGRAETAAKVDVYAAVYNDADVGIDEAGLSRLPALDARDIAAATVSAWSARIGDGMSTYRDGVVSYINETARRRGAAVGQSAADFVEAMKRAREKASRRI